MAVDSLWSNVSLLLPCSADLNDVKGHAVTAYGNAALSSSVGTPFGSGNACAFDGTGDYLTVPTGTDFAFGSGDFTIEGWIRRSVDMSSGTFRIVNEWNGTGYIFAVVNNNIYFGVNNGTAYSVTGSATTVNTWHFVTAKRSGSNIYVSVDGTLNSSAVSGSVPTPAGATYFGRASDGDSQLFTGYFADFRITKGSARSLSVPTGYFPRPTISGIVLNASAAAAEKTVVVFDRGSLSLVGGAISDPSTGAYTFYPPDFGEYVVQRFDEVFDPLWNWRTLFMPMDGADSSTTSIVDSKGHAVTLVGNTQLKTAQSITGGSSCYFDGSGDRITFAASADWDMSGGNFCIEFCIRANALPSASNFFRPFLFGANGSTSGLQVYILDTGAIGCGTPVGGNVTVLSAAGAIAANTWARIEISCSGYSARIFKDGALIAGPTTITAPVSSSSNTLAIGYDTGAGQQFAGYIDRIRVGRVAGHVAAFSSNNNAFPVGPTDGGSGENILVYDRVIPG